MLDFLQEEIDLGVMIIVDFLLEVGNSILELADVRFQLGPTARGVQSLISGRKRMIVTVGDYVFDDGSRTKHIFSCAGVFERRTGAAVHVFERVKLLAI